MPEPNMDLIGRTKGVGTSEAARASAVMAKAMEGDPALQNQLNQEPWWQSGVGVFGAGGVLWSVGNIIVEVTANGTDFNSYNTGLMIQSVGALVGFAAVLYRRFMPGLRPMFHGWFS